MVFIKSNSDSALRNAVKSPLENQERNAPTKACPSIHCFRHHSMAGDDIRLCMGLGASYGFSMSLGFFFSSRLWIECIRSTITSFSWTPTLLKCLRTASASCSFVCRCCRFRRAIVGDCRPMPPGREKTKWW